MTSKRRYALALSMLMLLLLISAAHAQDPVTIQLKWVHQAQFAGFYMAAENGYYSEEGFDVALIEGGPGIDKIDRLLSGRPTSASTPSRTCC